MRGDAQQDGMFSYLYPADRGPQDHPLRPIKKVEAESATPINDYSSTSTVSSANSAHTDHTKSSNNIVVGPVVEVGTDEEIPRE